MKIEELKYIIQSAHINFLYGSGVSRPYLSTLGNIEEYLTLLEKNWKDDDAYKVVKASLYKTYCDEVICPNYSFPRNDVNFIRTHEAYNDFFHIWNDIINKRSSLLLEKQVNMFTTNIDLIVEDTLSNSGLELNDGFRGTLNPSFDESNFQISLTKSSMQYHKAAEIPVFNLIKIHGSVNWEADDNVIHSLRNRCGTIKDLLDKIPQENFISLRKLNSTAQTFVDKPYNELILEASKIKLTSPDVFKSFFDEYNKIVMVNPTKEKFKTSVMDYHFYELMRIYSNALERENSVLFVMGFSFADEHIAQITKRAAATNPTLQVVIFAYGDKDKDKYIQNLNINGKGANNNIEIITPTDFITENTLKGDEYKKLCAGIKNFDLSTINLVFNEIGSQIHSSI